MIEEYGRVLSRIMGLTDPSALGKALGEIRESYLTYFGVDAAVIDKFHPDDLPLFLTKEHHFTFGQLEALAKGITAEGNLSPDEMVAKMKYRKALALYLWLEKEDTQTFSIHRKQAVNDLMNRIGQ
ncbi:MAG TPA: hypothetical protein VFU15_01780 [Bacteroidia bacterium]|nr:hypothetical protein [Bacteroidia bacterium]